MQTKENAMKHNPNSVRSMFADYPDLLSIASMQSALGIGRTKAYQLINDGTIKHMRIGKSIKIPKLVIIDFITRNCYNYVRSNGQFVLSQKGVEYYGDR